MATAQTKRTYVIMLLWVSGLFLNIATYSGIPLYSKVWVGLQPPPLLYGSPSPPLSLYPTRHLPCEPPIPSPPKTHKQNPTPPQTCLHYTVSDSGSVRPFGLCVLHDISLVELMCLETGTRKVVYTIKLDWNKSTSFARAKNINLEPGKTLVENECLFLDPGQLYSKTYFGFVGYALNYYYSQRQEESNPKDNNNDDNKPNNNKPHNKQSR